MLLVLVLLHIGVCIASLIWAYGRAKANAAERSYVHLGLVAILLFLLPIVGVVMFVMLQQRQNIYALETVNAMASLEESAVVELDKPSLAGFDTNLSFKRLAAVDSHDYLEFLMSGRGLKNKLHLSILKEGLDSKSESARLLAFALHSKKEQALFNDLHELESQLGEGKLDAERSNLAIAQLYWDLLESDMFDDVAAARIWQKLEYYANKVIGLTPQAWQGHWLKAKVVEHKGNEVDALGYYETAFLMNPGLSQDIFSLGMKDAHSLSADKKPSLIGVTRA